MVISLSSVSLAVSEPLLTELDRGLFWSNHHRHEGTHVHLFWLTWRVSCHGGHGVFKQNHRCWLESTKSCIVLDFGSWFSRHELRCHVGTPRTHYLLLAGPVKKKHNHSGQDGKMHTNQTGHHKSQHAPRMIENSRSSAPAPWTNPSEALSVLRQLHCPSK